VQTRKTYQRHIWILQVQTPISHEKQGDH